MSHYTLGLIVYANDRKEAEKARDNIMRLLACKECQDPFAGWRPSEKFDEDVNKESDFEPQPVSTWLSQRIIVKLMAHTKSDFFAHLDKVRAALAVMSNEKIFTEQGLGDLQYHLVAAGKYRGPGVYLYDDDGEGIKDPDHLRNAVEKWPTIRASENRRKLDAAGPPWLVLVDAVH